MKDYKRFLNVCIHLIELSPWDHVTSDEYCQIIITELKFPVLVSVLGSNRDHFGFLIASDPMQSSYLLSLQEDIEESELSSYRRMQCFMVNFETYKNINLEDRKTLRKYFGKLDHKAAYPILKKSLWDKDIVEASDDEFANICIVLENLYMLLEKIVEGKMVKDKTIEDADFPTRFYSPITELYNNVYMPLYKEAYTTDPAFTLDKKVLSKLVGWPLNNLVVEYDMLYLPLELESKNIALVYVLYDVKTNMILDMNVIDSNSDRAIVFVARYLDLVLEFGFFKEVRCRDDIDKRILDSLSTPKKPKTIVKPLKNIDIVIDEFVEKNIG